MPLIRFGNFAPDRSRFDPTTSNLIENVLPHQGSWGPFPSFETFTDALTERPQGTFLAYKDNGEYQLFVGGAADLWALNGSLGWDNVSKSAGVYNTAATERWSFAQFGDAVIATNGVDPSQKIDVQGTTSTTDFADIGGSPPDARHVTTLGDFVVLGHLGTDKNAIHWSGLNNLDFWTPRQRSSDFQSFPDGGEVVGMTGGVAGLLIFHANTIRMGQLALNTPLVMTFQQTITSHGCLAPRSIVPTSHGVFYLSNDGFYRYGNPPVPIGRQRVDDTFLADIDSAEIYGVYGSEDPNRKIVYWAYKSISNTQANTYDKVLLYHYGIDQWSLLTPGVLLSGLIDATSPGFTMETLDTFSSSLDALLISLDSRSWSGSVPTLAAFNTDFEMGFFSGAPLEATLQTGRVQLIEGRRSFVQGFRVLCDAPTVEGRTAFFDHAGAAVQQTPFVENDSSTGLIPMLADGRFHRFTAKIPSDDENTWTAVHGVEPVAVPSGEQ